jgi:hypothetical protein
MNASQLCYDIPNPATDFEIGKTRALVHFLDGTREVVSTKSKDWPGLRAQALRTQATLWFGQMETRDERFQTKRWAFWVLRSEAPLEVKVDAAEAIMRCRFAASVERAIQRGEIYDHRAFGKYVYGHRLRGFPPDLAIGLRDRYWIVTVL